MYLLRINPRESTKWIRASPERAGHDRESSSLREQRRRDRSRTQLGKQSTRDDAQSNSLIILTFAAVAP